VPPLKSGDPSTDNGGVDNVIHRIVAECGAQGGGGGRFTRLVTAVASRGNWDTLTLCLSLCLPSTLLTFLLLQVTGTLTRYPRHRLLWRLKGKGKGGARQSCPSAPAAEQGRSARWTWRCPCLLKSLLLPGTAFT
jgi:hypothetical protein